jgi:hypothetical protein
MGKARSFAALRMTANGEAGGPPSEDLPTPEGSGLIRTRFNPVGVGWPSGSCFP